MKALAAAAVLLGGAAHAQGPGSEGVLVLVLGPPMLISAAMDVTLLSTLVPEGVAGRGRSISTTAFGGVTAVIAGICLFLGFNSSVRDTTWTAISSGGLGIGLGTIAVAIYALTRPAPEPEPEPEKRKPKYERLYQPPPPTEPEEAPQQL